MAVVKYTLFVLLDGAGSQKNQHQSVVGVARGYKVGNCTPGVTDKMSVVAGGGRASPRAAEAGTWSGYNLVTRDSAAMAVQTTRRWTGEILQWQSPRSILPRPGPSAGLCWCLTIPAVAL